MGVDRHGNVEAEAIEVAAPFRRILTKRNIRRSAVQPAAEMIGKLEPGLEVTGLTNGQFSLVDMIEHVLDEVGSADVTIATWTMGIYDAERAYRFVRDRRINSIRFMVDASMFTRRAELAAVLVQGFGPEAFRAVASHAKFATIRGAELAVTIRSSMNLNANERLESFDVSVDDDLTAFFEAQVDLAWQRIDEASRSQSRAVFERLFEAKPMKSTTRANPWAAGAV